MIREAHVNGIKLVYREEGDPNAPLMVLIHGRTADHNDWNGITQHFAARHRVLVPDLRGHGGSDRPGAYPVPAMAEDVAGLIVRTGGGGPATVVGHSLGGMVAYRLAVSRPELVARLVLEDVPPPLPIADRPPLVEDGSTGFDRRMMHDTERQIRDPDPAWQADLARIAAPTLVVSGGAASPFDAAALAAMIPGAELVTIEAGHLVHATERAAFLRAVDAFLQG
ncbi:alpha/beta hydrolase [Actinomadura sp. ATCC 31491]|uniref:Alpha/beta hydrolase n=1 Tax=Actinomadura luzonensis TaxID=2805427 RepID=A0ABT0FYI6_9ACTN|nr:alpha/beta hydrolase [Actinomadura luzonensis]MCK2217375.1 alpha/beta hydrolase [Actinomadura luzonensis]